MKRFILTFIFSLFAVVLMAQVPAGFSYQAVVRNNSGKIVASQTVKFRFSILQNSSTGTSVYVETQSKETNDFGLANLVVGTGTKVSGNFDPADWGSHSHFLKVELDPNNGNSFSHLGTMQLMAVPYAFHAKTVEIEADGDPTNEIQALSISGTNLSLSKGGGTVTLPSSGGGDNWGTDYVRTDGTLSGQGTTAQPLKIAQQSATAGQVLKWSGATWAPAADETGESGGSPSGPAGGDLTGTYPDPIIGSGKVTETKIADNAITSAKIADGTIVAADIADNAVTNSKIINTAVSTDKLANSAVTSPKLASMGATAGQVLKWNGTTWVPATDETGESGGSPTGPAGGDLTGTYPDPIIGSGKVTEAKIADNAITSAKIADGTIVAADLANNAITTDKLNTAAVTSPKIASMGATVGQKLRWSGTAWLPSSSEGLTLPFTGETGSGTYGISITHTATSGTNWTGYFVNMSSSGIALQSWSKATSGGTIAGRFISESAQGTGVVGSVNATTGTNYGGFFTSGSTSGCGVYGVSPKYGIYGESSGNQGRGVTGEATGTASIGVRGVALASNSTGVWGEGSNYDFYANGPGVDYGTGSSIRWKRNIISIPDPLEKIAALRGVYFDWDEEHGGRHDIGMIAEEVGKVLPEIVIYEENGIDAMGMDYSKIGPLLIEAVKELKAENDRLKTENEKVNSRLEKLERFFSASAQNEK